MKIWNPISVFKEKFKPRDQEQRFKPKLDKQQKAQISTELISEISNPPNLFKPEQHQASEKFLEFKDQLKNSKINRQWQFIKKDRQEAIDKFFSKYSSDELSNIAVAINNRVPPQDQEEFFSTFNENELENYHININRVLDLHSKISQQREKAEYKIGTKLNEKYVDMKKSINLIDESQKFDSGLIKGQYLEALHLLKPNLGETVIYKLPLEMNKHAHIIYLTRTDEDELTILYVDPEKELHNILTGKIAKESSSFNAKLEARIDLDTGEYKIENIGEEIPLEYQGLGMRSIINDLDRILSGRSEGGNGPTITENEPESHVSFVIHDGISEQRLNGLANIRQLSLRE